MNIYKDKVVLITGAGSGIGRALALELSHRGAFVHLTDICRESAEKASKKCTGNASSERLDVTDELAVKNSIETLHLKHGRIDFLFNNAGIGISGEIQNIPKSDWDKIIEINILGVINGINAAYPLMIKQSFGHIINTSSVAGLGSAPLLTPYAMTKHAIVGLTSSLRVEAAHYGVRVSVLCPGSTDTTMLDTEGEVNVRRFLTNWTGKPYTASQIAREALKGIEKNTAVIVVPQKVKFFSTIIRLFPKVAERVSTRAHLRELKQMKSEAL